MAHIHGERESAARWIPDLQASEIGSPANLILLCPEHHRQIDSAEERDSFPADLLREWKRQSEVVQNPLPISEDTIERIVEAHNRENNIQDAVVAVSEFGDAAVTQASYIANDGAQPIQIQHNSGPVYLSNYPPPAQGVPAPGHDLASFPPPAQGVQAAPAPGHDLASFPPPAGRPSSHPSSPVEPDIAPARSAQLPQSVSSETASSVGASLVSVANRLSSDLGELQLVVSSYGQPKVTKGNVAYMQIEFHLRNFRDIRAVAMIFVAISDPVANVVKVATPILKHRAKIVPSRSVIGIVAADLNSPTELVPVWRNALERADQLISRCVSDTFM